MKEILVCFSLIFLFLLTACNTVEKKQTFLLCPDNITEVTNLSNCPVMIEQKCPVCEDRTPCTVVSCSPATNFTCVYQNITPCSGNGICEKGELGNSTDCPATCDDNNICTDDKYDYLAAACVHLPIAPCCGNGECEKSETYLTCPRDCNRSVELQVTSFEKKQRIQGAYLDLTGTDHTYVIVNFRVHNLNVDTLETINFKNEKGFYYDPYKTKAEDGRSVLYSMEYDSDLLSDWRDISIVPAGDSVLAALLFIVPKDAAHLRLVLYDRYSTRIDNSDIY